MFAFISNDTWRFFLSEYSSFFSPLRIQDEVKAVQRAESNSITTEYYLNSIQW